ncbi:SAV_6107 family HEPN domain-containing protein [Kineosporia sp. A_224]|uniref:SAV_6107 family HEPN domain-containing protein n=1 Tax=Kineosporia sp. A_224 TaxID=1962180 RepID=UPI0018E923C1|nr:SAV_6107 family HEPN domain-containing protein [Kineosporia sp. A_224]
MSGRSGPDDPHEHDPNDPNDPMQDTTGGAGPADQEADMPVSTLDRPPVSVAARMLLERSRAGLLQACAARSCGERYVAAHLAALRAGAAVLAVRGRATTRGGPRSVWDILPRVAPELTEWAAFFAATATRRAAIEAGRGEGISARDADDLLRDSETFHHVVETVLGMPYQPVLPGALPTCT